MNIESVEIADNTICVSLHGRLDVDGSRVIEDRFSFQTSTTKSHVIVDLSAVEFLASIGIRMLVSAARAKNARGGKLVLVSPDSQVKKVLVMAGIDQLIPVFADVTAARDSLQGA